MNCNPDKTGKWPDAIPIAGNSLPYSFFFVLFVFFVFNLFTPRHVRPLS